MYSLLNFKLWNELHHDKTNKMNVCPANTPISLGIRPVWSESSLCAQWIAKDPSFLHADSEDSDQTGRTVILLVLSCSGSNTTNTEKEGEWILKNCSVR